MAFQYGPKRFNKALTEMFLPNGHVILEEEIDEDYVPSREEIQEYAQVIGIDPDREPELMWLAEEGIAQPLPAGWKLCQDSMGQRYFFNFFTFDSTEEHPCKKHYRYLVVHERKLEQEREKALDSGLGSRSAELSQEEYVIPSLSEFEEDEEDKFMEGETQTDDAFLEEVIEACKNGDTREKEPESLVTALSYDHSPEPPSQDASHSNPRLGVDRGSASLGRRSETSQRSVAWNPCPTLVEELRLGQESESEVAVKRARVLQEHLLENEELWRLQKEKADRIRALKQETEEMLEAERQHLARETGEQLQAVRSELSALLKEARQEVQQEQKELLELLREEQRRDLRSIRESHQAEKEQLLSLLQKEKTRLRASCSAQVEDLRTQLESILQEMRTEQMLEIKDLKKRRQELQDGEKEMQEENEIPPCLLQERDSLQAEVERLREEVDRVREERDRAREESWWLREEKLRLESKVELLQEYLELSQRSSGSDVEHSESSRRPANKPSMSSNEPYSSTGSQPTGAAKMQHLNESVQQISGQLSSALWALDFLIQRQASLLPPGQPSYTCLPKHLHHSVSYDPSWAPHSQNAPAWGVEEMPSSHWGRLPPGMSWDSPCSYRDVCLCLTLPLCPSTILQRGDV
ncbi:golgin subfamily A member 6-like protein 22 isoform X2 [Scleropages formosus]|uniref:golgin subfamily A member 6-like protein 22 isoform X2 n=1 Tax=Scleropages formosus TaxID=113540 RepID=UPI0010FACD8D|nr:golgin subfamily A member 6-like protein 22 isoform X2 [Scleropages formosus]